MGKYLTRQEKMFKAKKCLISTHSIGIKNSTLIINSTKIKNKQMSFFEYEFVKLFNVDEAMVKQAPYKLRVDRWCSPC